MRNLWQTSSDTQQVVEIQEEAMNNTVISGIESSSVILNQTKYMYSRSLICNAWIMSKPMKAEQDGLISIPIK